MQIMEEIFQIRSCIEILANDIKIYIICSTVGSVALLVARRRTNHRKVMGSRPTKVGVYHSVDR